MVQIVRKTSRMTPMASLATTHLSKVLYSLAGESGMLARDCIGPFKK